MPVSGPTTTKKHVLRPVLLSGSFGPLKIVKACGRRSRPEAWIRGFKLDSIRSIGSQGGGIPAEDCEAAETRRDEGDPDPDDAIDPPGRPARREGFDTGSRETDRGWSHRDWLRSSASIRILDHCRDRRARRGRSAVAV